MIYAILGGTVDDWMALKEAGICEDPLNFQVVYTHVTTYMAPQLRKLAVRRRVVCKLVHSRVSVTRTPSGNIHVHVHAL